MLLIRKIKILHFFRLKSKFSFPLENDTCYRKSVHTVKQTTVPLSEKGLHLLLVGTRWRSWSRHYYTTQMIAGSIPDGVTGIFHCHNPSGRTVAFGSTQLLTEMSTRNISWGQGCRCFGLTTLQPYSLHVPHVLKSWILNFLEF